MKPFNKSLSHLNQLKLNNERGLTLIEALAATAILSLLVVVFITLSNYMMSTKVNTNRAEEASVIAESILSEMRLHPEKILNGNYVKEVPSPTYGNNRKYQVTAYKLTPYINNVSAPAVAADRLVSLQSLVYTTDAAGSTSRKLMLLTVTVSWEV